MALLVSLLGLPVEDWAQMYADKPAQTILSMFDLANQIMMELTLY